MSTSGICSNLAPSIFQGVDATRDLSPGEPARTERAVVALRSSSSCHEQGHVHTVHCLSVCRNERGWDAQGRRRCDLTLTRCAAGLALRMKVGVGVAAPERCLLNRNGGEYIKPLLVLSILKPRPASVELFINYVARDRICTVWKSFARSVFRIYSAHSIRSRICSRQNMRGTGFEPADPYGTAPSTLRRWPGLATHARCVLLQ